MTEHQPNIQVCCISLNSTDCIRLIGMPPEMVGVIRASISQSWGTIQSETPYHGSYQFKLKGNPWLGDQDEAVRSRSLLVSILTHMAQYGWNLLQSADTSKKGNDKDALFFEMAQPDPTVQMFGLSFNMTDRIRLINAPDEMRNILLTAVSAHVQIQNQRGYHGSYELKLSGNPWQSSYMDGSEGVMTRTMLCRVIANFRSAGYKLYASVDISGGFQTQFQGRTTETGDLESWVFRKVSPPFYC